jgi:hypothetical protein
MSFNERFQVHRGGLGPAPRCFGAPEEFDDTAGWAHITLELHLF